MTSTNRKMGPGEETSNGTFDSIDLCRRGLEKLKEIHYTGYKRFVSMNQEPIEGLKMILASHADGEDFEGEDAVAAHEAVDALWDAICELFNGEYCLFGTHFGSNEGCGSCFGCWPSTDYLDEESREDGTVVKETASDSTEFPQKINLPPEYGGKYLWVITRQGHQVLYDPQGDLLWKY